MLNPLSYLAAIVRNLLLVTPETIVMDAIVQMRSDPQSQLSGTQSVDTASSDWIVVVEDDRPIGMLTTADLVRPIAERQDLERLVMREVMTPIPVTLRESALTDLAVAIELLEQHQIGQLLVVDDRGCLVGLLTKASIQQQLVADLAAKVARADAQLQEQEVQVQVFCDRTKVIYQQVKSELDESQQFIQTVFDTFPLAVFWKDRESRFLGCNHQSRPSCEPQLTCRNHRQIRSRSTLGRI